MTRLGWIKFRECSEVLNGKQFSLKMKGSVYRSCVRSAMLYGSETWCLRETELAILRRMEKAMIKVICGVHLLDKRKTGDLMEMLGLEETLEQIVKANTLRWYGHVLRMEDGHALW